MLEDDVVPRSNAVDERDGRGQAPVVDVAQHRHDRRYAAATGNQDDPSVPRFIEVEPAERPRGFDHQSHGGAVVQEHRDPSVGNPLGRDLDVGILSR